LATVPAAARISGVTWTPNDEEELRWRFDGSAEAALGMRSWLGPMVDRYASGATRPFWAAVRAIEKGGAT
jgi:hypothetical protein